MLDPEFRFICENQQDYPFIDTTIVFQKQGEINFGELFVHILFGIAFNYYICVCMAMIIINLKKYMRGQHDSASIQLANMNQSESN